MKNRIKDRNKKESERKESRKKKSSREIRVLYSWNKNEML